MHEMGHAIDFWAFGRYERSLCLVHRLFDIAARPTCPDTPSHCRRYQLEDHPLTDSPSAELLRRSDMEENDPESRADCFGNIALSSITGNSTLGLRMCFPSCFCSPRHRHETFTCDLCSAVIIVVVMQEGRSATTGGLPCRHWWRARPTVTDKSCCCTFRTDLCVDTCPRSHRQFRRVLRRSTERAESFGVQGSSC